MTELKALIKKIQSEQIVFNKQKPGYFLIKNSLDSIEWMPTLIGLKNLYHLQLPRMPKQYIVKLVFDTFHQSLVYINQKNQIVSGVSFRFFKNKPFCQIAFFAVSQLHQSKGVGGHLMSVLKQVMQKRHIYILLTYADDRAVQFFGKQGFSQKIFLPRQTWKKCIKQYIGGTLMECRIHQTFPYRYRKQIVRLQKKIVIDTYKSLTLNEMCYDVKNAHQLLNEKAQNSKTFMKLDDGIQIIPGAIQSGWTRENQKQFMKKKNIVHMLLCHRVLEKLSNHSSSENYQPAIKVLEGKLINNEYKDNNQFKTDVIEMYKQQSKLLKKQQFFDPSSQEKQLFQQIFEKDSKMQMTLQNFFILKQKKSKNSRKVAQIQQ